MDLDGDREVRRWFPLHPTKARHSDVHGEVLLRIHYKTPLPGGLKLAAKTNEEVNEEAIAACKCVFAFRFSLFVSLSFSDHDWDQGRA